MVYLFPSGQSTFLMLYFQSTLRIQPYELVGEQAEGSWIIDILLCRQNTPPVRSEKGPVVGAARFVCRSTIIQPRFRNQAACGENRGDPIIRIYIAVLRTSTTWHRLRAGCVLLGKKLFVQSFVIPGGFSSERD